MNDPKYDIRDGRLWHREGHYYIPEEEPVMVLRGKDPMALTAIELYIEACLKLDQTPVVVAHLEGARRRLAAFKAYQERYPERTRVGCHNHV